MKTGKNTEYKTVAKRYSQALRELADSNSVKKDIILKDLIKVVETLKASEELVNLMKSPSVSKSDKKKVLEKIFKGNVLFITKNFLLYLVEKNRFEILESVMEEYSSELDKDNNYIDIEIVSAIELDENTKKTITDKLSKKLNKKLKADWSINSDIIGGLVFTVGDSIIDTSVKSKLSMIGRNIK